MKIVTPSVRIETPEDHIKQFMRMIVEDGRVCHPLKTGENPDDYAAFVKTYLIELGHESVLEHAVITARFICDRSASHQLVRHRIGAFSQESQRISDYSQDGISVICPPSVRESETAFDAWKKAVEHIEGVYKSLIANGIPPEDARSVLPNCTKTEIVATFNLRQWRHIFMQRALNPRAQWQIRMLMTDLLKEMTRLLPAVFEDLQQKILYKLVFDPPETWKE